MTIYAIVVTSALLWMTLRSAGWHDKYNISDTDRERLQKELDFTKSTIAGLYNKPVYVTLSTDQVEKIAIMVSMRMREPEKWPN